MSFMERDSGDPWHSCYQRNPVNREPHKPLRTPVFKRLFIFVVKCMGRVKLISFKVADHSNVLGKWKWCVVTNNFNVNIIMEQE